MVLGDADHIRFFSWGAWKQRSGSQLTVGNSLIPSNGMVNWTRIGLELAIWILPGNGRCPGWDSRVISPKGKS